MALGTRLKKGWLARGTISVVLPIGRSYWQAMRGMIDSSRNPASAVMLSPETILQGRYRIIRQLGQGGMGAVYEALDQRLDTTVALKETLFQDEKLRKQFEREARLLARLHHQALPRVSDHFNEGDGQFLVMQYVAGDDLSAMLVQRNAPFPQDEVLRWADQLCDALDYLHTQDPEVIHRDIKPQNLKLTSRGQIVLLDFGLAKGYAGQASVVTTSASIFGYTPNYAPLEQVQGLGTDARSDIYALAATLFHLLTNIKPPDALSRAGALVNGQPDPLLPANRVAPQVSVAVAHVLSKAMSQKRDDRFASALLMREAFRIAGQSGDELGDAETLLAARVAGNMGTDTVASDKATRLMGEQTRAATSEARTLLAADATKVKGATSMGEAATMVRSATGRGSRAWLAAALLIVLIAGGAGGFYVYRARRQQQSAAAPAQNSTQTTEPKQSPIISAPITTDSPNTSESKTEKKAESSQRSGTSKHPADKTAASKSNNSEPGNLPAPGHEADRNLDRRGDPNFGPSPQNRPPFDPLRNPRGRQPGHPPGPAEIPTVRTLPNGVRVVRQPDGTRVMTWPNGRVQVIPPGEKPIRKKDRP
jgi:eukaryotic-like serine/threonine-protein kinase